MEKRTAPKWQIPNPEVKVELPPLKLFNSLSNNKDNFVPKRGKEVTWYSCGPTVYDSSHMGHARSYISFDIIRRVLKDYFGFKVKYVMNITDVDDKIIKKARQNYLIEDYFLNVTSVPQAKQDIRNAIKLYEEKSKTHPEPEQRDYLKREVDRLRKLLTIRSSLSGLLTGAQDALSAYLDSAHGASISDYKIFESLPRRMEEEFHRDMRALNVLDADKLTRVSEYIEPIINYIQKIIDNGYAYAVESGSVYFDTKRFADSEGHFYAKLVPTAYGDAAKLASGEGELSAKDSEKRTFSDFALWKASKPGEPVWPSRWGNGRPGWHIECSVMASDTCGESMDIHTGGVDLKFPHHDNELAQSEAYFGHSHWVSYFLHAGHLTISGCKMSKSLKNFITIRDALRHHSARELRFAFLLHSWRDTLDYSADTMTQAVAFNKTIADFLYNVSHALRLASVSPSGGAKQASPNGSLPENLDMSKALAAAEKEVYDALCDSIDTRRAMAAIRTLITAVNQAECASPLVSCSAHLVERARQSRDVAAFILRLLGIFGAADTTALSDAWSPPHSSSQPAKSTVGLEAGPAIWVSMDAPRIETLAATLYGAALACRHFVVDVKSAIGGKSKEVAALFSEFEATLKKDFSLDIQNLPADAAATFSSCMASTANGNLTDAHPYVLETVAYPVVASLLYATADLRQRIRVYAQSPAAQSGGINGGALLAACDRLRDDHLPAHGIRLQDRMDLATDKTDVPSVGLVDAKWLAVEKKEKAEKEAEKAALKTKQAAAKVEVGKQAPSNMFRCQSDKYSAFDDKGMPTHDAEGKEITKSQLKKLQKLYDAQTRRHEVYLASLTAASSP